MNWPDVPMKCLGIFQSDMYGIATSDIVLRQSYPELLLYANATAWQTPQPHHDMCEVDALAVLSSPTWATAFAAQLSRCT